ncbi:hypothetical protein K1719_014038 [Acacia pycnantha]|nr:hypothetical protein K1719_014038 [Acacia pycnantha]
MDGNQISSPIVWKESEAERILIGKVLSNKTYTRSAMELILRKAWNLQEGFDVIEIDSNTFMFKFADGDEYNRILRGRPWSINGYVLNLLERSKYKSCEEFDFSRCPMWIKMHNVPMEAMCLENAVTISSYVREIGHDNRNCGSARLMSVPSPNEPRFGAWLTTKLCRSWDEMVVVIQNNWSEAEYARRKKEEALDKESLFFIKTHKSVGESKGTDQKEESGRDTLGVVDPNVVGGSGLEEGADVATKFGEVDGDGYSGRTAMNTVANPLAMVVYDRGSLGENLRKTKAKIHRSARRKGKEEKENISDTDMNVEEQMGISVESNSRETGFVFKVGRGRQKKCTAGGSGGWPLSATQVP